MSVLEEERTEDIYTCATDDEKLSEQSDREEKSLPSERAQNSTRNSNQIESKVLNLKSRLPGQVIFSIQISMTLANMLNSVNSTELQTNLFSKFLIFDSNASVQIV